jgi:hypothetical protein
VVDGDLNQLGLVFRYQDEHGRRSARAKVGQFTADGGYQPLPDDPDQWWAPVVELAHNWVTSAEVGP